MKKCELCDSPANLYCESDQASLCWDWDAKVHSANFIVAKHCRVLLCNVCQSLTPWNGSGHKLRPTISVCEDCFASNGNETGNEENGENGGGGTEEEEEDGNNELHGEEEEYDDDQENQVVPWSSTPPPPVSSSSNSSDGPIRFYNGEEVVSD